MRVTFHGVRGSTPCQSDDIRGWRKKKSVCVDAPGDPLLSTWATVSVLRKAVRRSSVPGERLLTHLPGISSGVRLRHLLRECSSLTFDPAQDDGRTLAEVCSTFARRCSPQVTSCRASLFTTQMNRVHDRASKSSRIIPQSVDIGFRVRMQGLPDSYLSDHQQLSTAAIGVAGA